jgi:L-threonylcarbamoyladenylate synthase
VIELNTERDSTCFYDGYIFCYIIGDINLNTLLITDNDMAPAAEIIKSGGLVVVPTETVYGLAADGLNGDAVQKIYDVKGRPETKPISLLVTGMDDVERFCRAIPKEAYMLAECFWPGPLTIILYKNDSVPDIVTAGGKPSASVARTPEDAGAHLLAGVPLAARRRFVQRTSTKTIGGCKVF